MVEKERCSDCEGFGFRGALADLAVIAGLGGSNHAIPRPLPKRELPQEEAVVIEALAGEAALKWERACAELYTDGAEVARWAVPAGRTANGLPASAQLAARPFAEGLLIRVAAAHERALQASGSS
jgi:hypothetical protein